MPRRAPGRVHGNCPLLPSESMARVLILQNLQGFSGGRRHPAPGGMLDKANTGRPILWDGSLSEVRGLSGGAGRKVAYRAGAKPKTAPDYCPMILALSTLAANIGLFEAPLRGDKPFSFWPDFLSLGLPLSAIIPAILKGR